MDKCINCGKNDADSGINITLCKLDAESKHSQYDNCAQIYLCNNCIQNSNSENNNKPLTYGSIISLISIFILWTSSQYLDKNNILVMVAVGISIIGFLISFKLFYDHFYSEDDGKANKAAKNTSETDMKIIQEKVIQNSRISKALSSGWKIVKMEIV